MILEGMRSGQLQLLNEEPTSYLSLLSQHDVALDIGIVRLLFGGYTGQICQLLLDLKCDQEAIKTWARRQVRDMMIPVRSLSDLKICFYIS